MNQNINQSIEKQRLVRRLVKAAKHKLNAHDANRIINRIILEITALNLDYKSDAHYTGWLDYRDELRRLYQSDYDIE